MASALVQVAPASAMADEDAPMRASIEELLSAGDYVEGEVIVLVRPDGDLDDAGDVETLAEVDTDAVELAAENAADTKNTVDDEAALRTQSARSDAYTVQYVVDPSRTTEQLLRDLYADPDVIAAEPNYTLDGTALFGNEAPAADEGAGTGAGAGAATQQKSPEYTANPSNYLTTAANFAANPGNLTEQQWDLSASTANYTTPRAPVANYNINAPGWREGRNNPSAPANASGTVCIMDTGIDVNHPDLKGVIFEFSEAQQQKYGCWPSW